jgi:hypothetical protein
MTTPAAPRRDSQWDDHGETYGPAFDGPNLFCTLKIPAGNFCLSIYEMNSNGHAGEGRYRDFRISVREQLSGALKDVRGFDKMPELASARVNQFWAGVYKRFAVKGPIEITVKVDRNYSLNANAVAVMLDECTDTPEPYFARDELRDAMTRGPTTAPDNPEFEEVARLFKQYIARYESDPTRYCDDYGQTYCMVLRWMNEQVKLGHLTMDKPFAQIAAKCYYHLHMFEQMEAMQKRLGLKTAREIENALKWDERIPNNSGLGRYNVTEYLDQLRQASAATRPAISDDGISNGVQ